MVTIFRAKDIFEKILMLNSMTSLVALFICFFGTIPNYESYLDIALIYFLLSYIGSMAYMKYFLLVKGESE